MRSAFCIQYSDILINEYFIVCFVVSVMTWLSFEATPRVGDWILTTPLYITHMHVLYRNRIRRWRRNVSRHGGGQLRNCGDAFRRQFSTWLPVFTPQHNQFICFHISAAVSSSSNARCYRAGTHIRILITAQASWQSVLSFNLAFLLIRYISQLRYALIFNRWYRKTHWHS